MNNIIIFISFFSFSLIIAIFLILSIMPFTIAELMSNIKTDDEMSIDNFIFQKKYILDNKFDMSISSVRITNNGKKLFLYYDGKIKYINNNDLSRLMLILRDRKN